MSKSIQSGPLRWWWAIIALVAAACSTTQAAELPYVDLAVRAPLPAVERPLLVAVDAILSPQGTLDSYRELTAYLSETLHRPVEIVQRRTYAEINALIARNQVGLGFVCPSAYLDGEAEGSLALLAAPGRIIVLGRPSHSLAEVLPHLATLPNVLAYNPETSTLTLRRQPGLITFHADRVSITQVRDVAEGLALLAALRDAVKVTWEHRAELTAVTARRRAPGLLDIWALLPRTNCRQCGEQTCMAFAAGLLQQRRTLVECPVIESDATLHDRSVSLEGML